MTGTVMNEKNITGNLAVTGTISGTIQIGGGSEPVLESVTVRSKPGQDQTVTPEEGVDGFSSITVRRTPLTTKVITPTTQAQTYRASDDDVQGYSQVTVGAVNLQTKTVTPSSVQQVVTPDTGWDGLSSVTVGASTDRLNDAFNDGLDNVTLIKTGNNSSCDLRIRNLTLQGFTSIASTAFYHKGLVTVSAPDCTSVGGGAFNGCTSLTTVDLPKWTGDRDYTNSSIFNGCTALANVNVPLLESVANSAFSGCFALASIRLPKCTYISAQAFQSCMALKDIYLGSDTMCTLANKNAFTSSPIATDSTARIHVPLSLEATYKADSVWSNFADIIVGDYA